MLRMSGPNENAITSASVSYWLLEERGTIDTSFQRKRTYKNGFWLLDIFPFNSASHLFHSRRYLTTNATVSTWKTCPSVVAHLANFNWVSRFTLCCSSSLKYPLLFSHFLRPRCPRILVAWEKETDSDKSSRLERLHHPTYSYLCLQLLFDLIA